MDRGVINNYLEKCNCKGRGQGSIWRERRVVFLSVSFSRRNFILFKVKKKNLEGKIENTKRKMSNKYYNVMEKMRSFHI